MTRKHFEQLARNLKNTRPTPPRTNVVSLWDQTVYEAQLHQWQRSVDAVASACQTSNDRFDRNRFLEACGAKRENPAYA